MTLTGPLNKTITMSSNEFDKTSWQGKKKGKGRNKTQHQRLQDGVRVWRGEKENIWTSVKSECSGAQHALRWERGSNQAVNLKVDSAVLMMSSLFVWLTDTRRNLSQQIHMQLVNRMHGSLTEDVSLHNAEYLFSL